MWGGVGRCGEVGGGKVNPVNAGLTGRLGLPQTPPGRLGRRGASVRTGGAGEAIRGSVVWASCDWSGGRPCINGRV